MLRQVRDRAFWVLCLVAFAIIVAPSIAILISVFHQAAPVFGWHLFTTVSKGDHGGLENALLGSLLLLLGVLVVAGTVGVAAGIYLAEYATGALAATLRFFSEVLSGVPSIVIGYVGYTALVVGFHWGNSLLAAVLALSVLVVPYIVKTTEVAVRGVPSALREAAAGLGVTQSRTVWRILLPPAVPGIVSGLIIALAISVGETAPLLFTAGYLDGRLPSLSLFHHQVPYLTYVTYQDIALPGASAHALAAAAGAVTLLLLLALIVAGRLVAARSRRMTARMGL